jgi:putative ABC transport system permease protein
MPFNLIGRDEPQRVQTGVVSWNLFDMLGVLPSIPQYPNENDVYMPVTACPFRNGEGWRTTRTARGLTVVGKLKEGESLAGLEGDLSTVAGRLHSEYPETYPADARARDDRGSL